MHKKAFVMFLIVIGLLIGFSVDQSFAGQVNQKYWPTKEWRTSTPEAQDMDSTQLGKMNNYLENKCPLVRSVLVIRNGYIVFENYYIGDANTTHRIYSVTKSITSALIGIALDKGYIKSLDQKMVTFFPEYAFVFFFCDLFDKFRIFFVFAVQNGKRKVKIVFFYSVFNKFPVDIS